jgi:hypothetical protein
LKGVGMLDLGRAIERAWPLFVEAARAGRTITYTELAARVGPPFTRRQIHTQLLTPLAARCRLAGLPDLSALVVRKDTGMPGTGWHGSKPSADPAQEWADALARCFDYRWPARPDRRVLEPNTDFAEKDACAVQRGF